MSETSELVLLELNKAEKAALSGKVAITNSSGEREIKTLSNKARKQILTNSTTPKDPYLMRNVIQSILHPIDDYRRIVRASIKRDRGMRTEDEERQRIKQEHGAKDHGITQQPSRNIFTRIDDRLTASDPLHHSPSKRTLDLIRQHNQLVADQNAHNTVIDNAVASTMRGGLFWKAAVTLPSIQKLQNKKDDITHDHKFKDDIRKTIHLNRRSNGLKQDEHNIGLVHTLPSSVVPEEDKSTRHSIMLKTHVVPLAVAKRANVLQNKNIFDSVSTAFNQAGEDEGISGTLVQKLQNMNQKINNFTDEFHSRIPNHELLTTPRPDEDAQQSTAYSDFLGFLAHTQDHAAVKMQHDILDGKYSPYNFDPKTGKRVGRVSYFKSLFDHGKSEYANFKNNLANFELEHPDAVNEFKTKLKLDELKQKVATAEEVASKITNLFYR